MNIRFGRAALNLEARQVIRLYDSAGTRVECVRGALWITQHGDREDHFLAASDALILDRPGLALIQAREPSEVILHEPAPRPSLSLRLRGALRATLRATGGWIARHFGPEAVGDRRWRGGYGAL